MLLKGNHSRIWHGGISFWLSQAKFYANEFRGEKSLSNSYCFSAPDFLRGFSPLKARWSVGIYQKPQQTKQNEKDTNWNRKRGRKWKQIENGVKVLYDLEKGVTQEQRVCTGRQNVLMNVLSVGGSRIWVQAHILTDTRIW